ncbi:MAG: hypothetical protein WCI05_15105, partial [Myxococcales bacterium]
MMTRTALAALVLAFSCRGGPTPTDARPAPDLAALHPLPSPSASPESGLPTLQPVLDDPRLSEARLRLRQKEPAAAAQVIATTRPQARLSPQQDCAWTYLEARLHAQTGDFPGALPSFEKVARDKCPLSAYATLRAAQTALSMRRTADALAHARSIPEPLARRDESRLVLAEALAAQGDYAAAVPLWRSVLAQSPTGRRWPETAAHLASAVLKDAPEEAFNLATRIAVDAPAQADALHANSLRTRALERLPARQLALDPAQRVRQAQAWLESSNAPKAARLSGQLLAKALAPDLACKAAITRAQASPALRPRDRPADPWGDAITRCEGESLANALYQGARASSQARNPDEAVARYAKLEALFPQHRLADDARLQSALLARQAGDMGRFYALASTVPDLYPNGDQRPEALFRVALSYLVTGDLDHAEKTLDRAISVEPTAKYWANPGRAAYFRARLAELRGNTADAKPRYAAVIADFPLTYFMLLAYARLSEADPAAAKGALDQAVAREPATPFLSRPHPELATASFECALRLLEVGEVETPRRKETDQDK